MTNLRRFYLSSETDINEHDYPTGNVCDAPEALAIIEALRAEGADLTEDLRNAEAVVRELVSQVAAKNKIVDDLYADVQRGVKVIVELKAQLDAKDEALANLRGSLASTKLQLSAESTIAWEAKKRVAELEEQKRKLIDSLKDSAGSYVEMQQAYGAIFAENCEYQGRIAELEAQLYNLGLDHSRCREDAIRQSIADDKKIAELESQLAAAKAETAYLAGWLLEETNIFSYTEPVL